MKIKDITNYLEELAPLKYAEDFDNVGLLVGSHQTTVTNVLVTLDTLEETIDEAISKNCNLIISFHPIIFGGLKKLNGNSYVERVVLKAIKNDVAIYATHTALDNSASGVSAKIGEVLGLQNLKILIPKKGIIKKLTTYVPESNALKLKKSLFDAGAGTIGNYTECSFLNEGISTFKGNEKANPVIGKSGTLTHQKEQQITVTFESRHEETVLKALKENHPYEEVAFEVVTTENYHQNIGMGMIGELPNEMEETEFLHFIKSTMQTDCVRHSKLLDKKIKKVAVLGGSGSFAISNAIKAGADAYVSADFKYHEFFKAEKSILIADIGHYESEQFTKKLLVDYLTKKFSNFAIVLSQKSTNPIYYI
ncbi:Nif3-like dinuclear metal center hexameric protein [Polaribacter tangerinus]|uniref:Nif3-like dinuclear metal center hexameric protein n=1 Tax=Polaribacter tangerinus TaxID=1920034 RepID=UPI000B4BA65F|nr:Nif3-like dinuclear metal center hexameric protein [Polaribacter tangerinus]